MHPEPDWSDTTLVLDLLVEIREDVERLLYLFEDDDEEEDPEADA